MRCFTGALVACLVVVTATPPIVDASWSRELRGRMPGTSLDTLVAFSALLLSTTLAVFYIKDRRRAAFDLQSRYTHELVTWHNEVVDVLVRLRTLKHDVASEEGILALTHLSALIEQGRFFFPNIDLGDGYGMEKPTAYRGYRNLALDFLVASYNLFHACPSTIQLEDAELLQRYFTSIVFEVVRPSARLDMIRKHTDRYFAVEKTFEDFLNTHDGKIIEHIWTHPTRNPQ